MRFVGEKEPWWVLSREEQRSLAITFAGGLGSIIAGACVIGGAIALARYEESFGLGPFGMFITVTLLGLLFVLALVLFRYIVPDDKVGTWAKRVAIAAAGFGFAFTLLVWIGVAAGIK